VSDEKKVILFVDDELPLLQLMSALMAQRSGEKWEVLQAESAAKALGLLKERTVNLMVVDARMPVMNGLQFIRLARPKHPHVPIILLTGYVEEQNKEAYAREGVDVILDKPHSSEGYETLFLTLNELLGMERRQGFRGLLDRVELQDIIQLECLRRNSSVLDVFTTSESGEIVIRNGIIVHAAVGSLRGEPAFNHLLTLNGGEFRLKPYHEPAETTIGMNWEVLLMEAARLRDEVAHRISVPADAVPETAARKSFPPVELSDADKASPHKTRQFLAISRDGDMLIGTGHNGNASTLVALTDDHNWFNRELNLGHLHAFEALTSRSKVAVQFQADAIVLAVEERNAHE
jgi:CheY-like chemotaxis protein